MLLPAGYLWVLFSICHTSLTEAKGVEICVFRIVTGIPCPACGSTRAVVSIFKGDFYEAMYTNPLGFLIAFAMLILPFWLITDTILKKDSLFKFYLWFEKFILKKNVMIIVILLILANWGWNIYKSFTAF